MDMADVTIEIDEATALRCKSGHPVCKLKQGLQPWQGILRGRACNRCGGGIGRSEPHWRCSHHCKYDVCVKCQESHQHGITSTAQQVAARRASAAAESSARAQAQERIDKATSDWSAARTSKWTCVAVLYCVVATPLVDLTGGTIVTDATFGLRRPFLMVGLVNFVAWIFCRLALKAAGSNHVAGPQESYKLATMLGALRALEMGLGFTFMQNVGALNMQGLVYAMVPGFVYLGGMYLGSEQRTRTLSCAITAAVLGGFLASPRLLREEQGDALLMMIGIGFAKALRWVLTQKSMASPGLVKPSPLMFAAKMLPGASAVGFEYSYFKENTSWEVMKALPNDGAALALVCAMAFCVSILLVLEAKTIQLHSATLLGVIAPLHGVGALILNLVAATGSPAAIASVPMLNWIGAVLCVAACLLYATTLKAAVEPMGGDAYGYMKLESGWTNPRKPPLSAQQQAPEPALGRWIARSAASSSASKHGSPKKYVCSEPYSPPPASDNDPWEFPGDEAKNKNKAARYPASPSREVGRSNGPPRVNYGPPAKSATSAGAVSDYL